MHDELVGKLLALAGRMPQPYDEDRRYSEREIERLRDDIRTVNEAAEMLSCAVPEAALIPELVAMLKRSKRGHYYCEDSWYSCPKAEDGCADERKGDECDCGADAWNAELQALLDKCGPQGSSE